MKLNEVQCEAQCIRTGKGGGSEAQTEQEREAKTLGVCLSARSSQHYPTLHQCTINALWKVIVRGSQVVSQLLDVCLRLPPAATELHDACSYDIIILAIVVWIVVEVSHAVGCFKTFGVKRLSSHVCCCLSVFWSKK